MLDAIDRKSRQEKTRDFLNQFTSGEFPTPKLTMKLFPSELDRFKKEFLHLDFKVTRTLKYYSSKQFEVQITKKGE